MSEPETVCPQARRIRAMPDMCTPPMPTRCTRGGRLCAPPVCAFRFRLTSRPPAIRGVCERFGAPPPGGRAASSRPASPAGVRPGRSRKPRDGGLWRPRGWINEELSRIKLREGDALVLQGDEEALSRVANDRAFLMMVPFRGEARPRGKAPGRQQP